MNKMVLDDYSKREYYMLRSDNNTVEFLQYLWDYQIEKYVPDYNYTFKLNKEGFNSWKHFCQHIRQHGFLTVEEVLQKGVCRP